MSASVRSLRSLRPWVAVLRMWRLSRWHRVDEPTLPELLDPDLVRAMYLTPGLRVRNPNGHEPWVLDLLEVSRPDVDLMVTLVAAQGTERVALDWPVEIYTAETALLEASLLQGEHQRLAGEQ